MKYKPYYLYFWYFYKSLTLKVMALSLYFVLITHDSTMQDLLKVKRQINNLTLNERQTSYDKLSIQWKQNQEVTPQEIGFNESHIGEKYGTELKYTIHNVVQSEGKIVLDVKISKNNRHLNTKLEIFGYQKGVVLTDQEIVDRFANSFQLIQNTSHPQVSFWTILTNPTVQQLGIIEPSNPYDVEVRYVLTNQDETTGQIIVKIVVQKNEAINDTKHVQVNGFLTQQQASTLIMNQIKSHFSPEKMHFNHIKNIKVSDFIFDYLSLEEAFEKLQIYYKYQEVQNLIKELGFSYSNLFLHSYDDALGQVIYEWNFRIKDSDTKNNQFLIKITGFSKV